MKIVATIILAILCTILIMGWLTRGLHNVRIITLFTWYDMWVGVFWDSKKKWLYVLPLPMIGFIIKFK